VRITTRGHLLNAAGRPRKPTTQPLFPTLQHNIAQILLISLPQFAHHLYRLVDHNRRRLLHCHRSPYTFFFTFLNEKAEDKNTPKQNQDENKREKLELRLHIN
jgi:hypothetical protein